MNRLVVLALALLLIAAPAIPAQSGPGGDQDDEDSSSRDRSDGSERNETAESNESNEDDGADRNESSDADENGTADQERSSRDGAHSVGRVSFQRDGDTIRDLQVDGEPLLSELTIPGLTPVEDERRRGQDLRIEGEDAELRIQVRDRVALEARSQGTLQAVAPGEADLEPVDDGVELVIDDRRYLLEGDALTIDDGVVTASEDLSLTGIGPAPDRRPTWTPDRPTMQSTELPFDFEGRYVSFTLGDDGLRNITVHGVHLGNVSAAVPAPEEVERRGATFEAEGEGFELKVTDAPAVQVRIEAEDLDSDLPATHELASGARVTVQAEDDELRLRVDRPAGALANETIARHEPPQGPVETTGGPTPSVRTRTVDAEMGLQSQAPGRLTASFQGQINGSQGDVGLDLTVDRALLLNDTNGNGHVDVGEPSLAQIELENGTTTAEDGVLTSTFALWSGNLTVRAELGNGTAKVDYIVEDLNAPPGTLFVLETVVQAPPGAQLSPTDAGVTVRNGPMTASYSAAGPVTVDGSSAWANHAVLVPGDGTARIMVAYPAGDDIVHDPTIAIQSIGSTTAAALASPYAVLVGALAAGLLVGVTVLQRRQNQP